MPAPTILVVDDEQLIRWSLSERLTAEGCTVLEAGTAREALERFGGDVDLVLLDYRLPDSDGLRVLKKMKAAEPDVPVILLTAFSSIETAVEAMKQGACHAGWSLHGRVRSRRRRSVGRCARCARRVRNRTDCRELWARPP